MERMTEVRTKEAFFKLGTFLWLVDEHTRWICVIARQSLFLQACSSIVAYVIEMGVGQQGQEKALLKNFNGLRAKERSAKSRADQSKPLIVHGKWHN
ncbi:hypothetical protein niasHT_034048 [Heterodera trifolii]|uniref:Uncharacterized protein n=1 Tax=Heterodera trifolii TaxID=157864 RepID=A0ABD2IZ08_9BILA